MHSIQNFVIKVLRKQSKENPTFNYTEEKYWIPEELINRLNAMSPSISLEKRLIAWAHTHTKSVSQASQLIGRKVAWKSGKNKIIGKIVDTHGNKGLVRAKFRKGLPGQALGTTVELVG